MLSLSTPTKEAIKTGLAMAIVYAVAMQMGWERPYWAGFAVAMISLSTVGQSLNKGAMRMLGTLVAAVASLIFLSLFAQERWWFMTVVSIYVGICAYMMLGKKHQYFYFVALFVCVLISADAGTSAATAFDTALARTQETGMGIAVYTLVSVFLWPNNSARSLDNTAQQLLEVQAKLYRAYRELLKTGGADNSQDLRLQRNGLLARLGQDVNAAITDTYEVFEVRDQWRRLQQQSMALAESLERWRESFKETRGLDLKALLPNLQGVGSELAQRFDQIARMLARQAPEKEPQSVTLTVDSARVQALSHFERAGVAVLNEQIDRIESLTRSIFSTVADIRGFEFEIRENSAQTSPNKGFSLDPDRLEGAFRIMATLWLAFLIFVLFPGLPGEQGFVSLSATFAAVIAQTPTARASIMFLPFCLGALFAGVLYIFVMPQLSGYLELGSMIFLATFVIYTLFGKPGQALAKMAGVVSFVSLVSIQNEQTYSFAGYANGFGNLMMVIALAAATQYIPASPRPEKRLLRLLARFFRNSEYLMSRLALDWREQRGVTDLWKSASYRNDLLELAQKIHTWSQLIDYRSFPRNTPEQVRLLVWNVYGLAFRINALVDAREEPQAELLVAKLGSDIRAWRVALLGLFDSWAKEPGASPKGDLHERLEQHLTTTEERLGGMLSLEERKQLSDEDYRNFYRVMGSYRGLSEVVVEYANLAAAFDWRHWREARF